MSLIICSSSQDVYETRSATVVRERLANSFGASGIQRPFSFQNFINPDIVIKPNSEIAVQSIKMRRAGTFKILQDLTFGWYYGEPIAMDQEDTTDLSLKIEDMTSSIIPITIKKGVYGMADFSQEIARGLRDRFAHPDWFRNAWVYALNDPKDGYGWVVKTQGNQGSNDTKAQLTDAGCQPWIPASNNFSFADQTFTCEGDFDSHDLCCAICEDLPLSQIGGVLTYDVTGTTDEWCCGLTRPTARDGRQTPFYFNDESGIFYDYVAKWESDVEEGFLLKLYHAVWRDRESDGSPRGRQSGLHMEEIKYYGFTSTDFSPALPTDDTNMMTLTSPWGLNSNGALSSVSFEIQGENVLVSAVADLSGVATITEGNTGLEYQNGTTAAVSTTTDSVSGVGLSVDITIAGGALTSIAIAKAGTGYEVGDSIVLDPLVIGEGESMELSVGSIQGPTTIKVIDPTLFVSGNSGSTVKTPLKGQVPKPTSMATWSLYPKMSLLAQDDIIEITAYSGVKPVEDDADGTIPAYKYPQIADDSSTGVATNGSSVWGRCWNAGGEMATIMRNLESRSWNNMTDGIPRDRPYVGLDAAGGGIDFRNVLVIQPSSPYEGSENPIDDTRKVLGFANQSASCLTQGKFGSTTQFDATGSTNEPTQFARWIYESTATPTGFGGSLFVRTPSLTNRSFNMGKSIPSKILFHCPKFDNQGNTEGELFFEPHEKTYVSLDNPSEMRLNNMLIELVDKNENLAEDLTGSTTIVFHIRQERR